MTTPAETLYIKVGKRYKPAHTVIDQYAMTIPVGTFVLIHAYTEGGKMYQYNVTPATAEFLAAATIARQAMVKAMRDKAPANPQSGTRQYTPQELAIIEKFRQDMAAIGSMLPDWWQYVTPDEIAQAGIDAVGGWK